MDVYVLKTEPEKFGEKIIEIRNILRNAAKQELLKKSADIIQLEYDLRKVFNMSPEQALKNAMYLSSIKKNSYEDFSYFAECMSVSKSFGISEILDSLQDIDGFNPTKQNWNYNTKIYYWIINNYYCIQLNTLQETIRNTFQNIPYIQRFLDGNEWLETYNKMISAKLSDGIEINCSYKPDFSEEELILAKTALTKEQRAKKIIQKNNFNNVISALSISSNSFCNMWHNSDDNEKCKMLIDEILIKLPCEDWDLIVKEKALYDEDLEY